MARDEFAVFPGGDNPKLGLKSDDCPAILRAWNSHE
jgi:hypothetical protein